MFRFFQVIVVLFRLITPLSYVGLGFMYFYPVVPEHVGGVIPYYFMMAFMLAEALFFPYYLHLFKELHEAAPRLEHFANCKRSRMKLAVTCIEALSLSARPGRYVI